MKIVNLTPHDVVVSTETGERIAYPSAGVARVSVQPRTSYKIEGLPCSVLPSPVWGAVEGLPPPTNGECYIVSLLVLTALKGSGRSDVFSPATGPNEGAIREGGHIVAVTQLVAAY